MHCDVPFRRWLILTQYYHPEPGAPQIRLRTLARELVHRGCTVEILTGMPNYPTGKIYPDYRGKLASTEIVDGCKVRRMWLYAGAGRNSMARLLCYLSFSLAAIVRVPLLPRYDVIFVEAQPITLAVAGWLRRLLRGTPFIYNTPDLQVEIAGEQRWIGSRALLKMAGALEGFLMRRSFCVATVTPSFVDHFADVRGIPRSHISFLPNGADTTELRPMPPDAEYARGLGVTGKKIFAYCGTLAHYHSLEVLIDAATKLRERRDLVILLAGRGPLGAELKAHVRDLGLSNVQFVDSPFSEMRRLMSLTTASLATVANMPAASKMRLSKVVPPLACGVPVIYCGDGEFTEVLKGQDCGWVVPGGSSERLAATIREVADDAATAASKGRRGRAYVEEHLSWSQIVDRWLDDLRCVQAGEDLWAYRSKLAGIPRRTSAVEPALASEPSLLNRS